jgi:alkanesulfonate monooxygenase SsuD/methylene tetrahydromethanopterin reductase-like flavin-dependent oxidoreductase (luciferase family)
LEAAGFHRRRRQPTRQRQIIDAVVAHGTPDDIAKRLGEYLTAGANHVAILVYGGPEKVLPTLSELAGPLGLSR